MGPQTTMLTRMKKVRGNRPRGLPIGAESCFVFSCPAPISAVFKKIFVDTGFSFMVKPVPVSLHE